MTPNDVADTANQPREIKFEGSSLKDLKALPQGPQDQIANSLLAIQHGSKADLDISHLSLPGNLVAMELKIQGSPAYRCVINMKDAGFLYVLYVGKKTATGTDKKLMETVIIRLKAVEAAKKQDAQNAKKGSKAGKAGKASKR